MQRQEGCAEAGREGRSRFGDAAFGSGQFGGEAGQEVVFGLFRGQDRNRRQHAESVGRQEDHLFGSRAFRNRFNDVLDVVDRIRNAGVFGYRFVGEIDRTVRTHRYVFEQRVALDGVPDVRFAILVEVDHFRVAAALEVEDAVVVPAVLVVADQQTFRVGRKGGFAGAGQPEEDCGVAALQVGVGRAVHRSHAFERQQVVHVREHAFFHFAAVPGVDDDLHLFGQVEYDRRFGVQPQFLVVFHFGFRRVQYDEVGFAVVGQLFGGRANEHIGHEMSLPGHFHDEADLQAAVFVGSAERVDDEQAFFRKLVGGDVFQHFPALFTDRLVVVLVFVGSPPDRVLGYGVFHEKFIFRRAAGVNAGHHVYGSHIGYLSFFETLQTRFGLLCEQLIVRGIVYDLGNARDPVLAQINL